MSHRTPFDICQLGIIGDLRLAVPAALEHLIGIQIDREKVKYLNQRQLRSYHEVQADSLDELGAPICFSWGQSQMVSVLGGSQARPLPAHKQGWHY
jgi:hypothetical protein